MAKAGCSSFKAGEIPSLELVLSNSSPCKEVDGGKDAGHKEVMNLIRNNCAVNKVVVDLVGGNFPLTTATVRTSTPCSCIRSAVN